ncbi:hypothetical protein A3860_32530 [Niastella vici]|uniref:DUF3859 domain-containing protein n=1 Tax=Niastella vici TaxID=1703345 RepID=A0A1V9FR10_9BACT|nr:hypothetical protein A3860_32530 [Niastella vici]
MLVEQEKIKQVKLLKFGLLTTDEEKKEHNNESLSGYLLYPTTIEFIETTDKLEGIVGLKFGIEYSIEGYTDEKFVDVTFTCKISHPLLTYPNTGDSSTVTVETKNSYLNENNFDYFCFEYDWEIKKGAWTFQILENEVIKLEKTFEVL